MFIRAEAVFLKIRVVNQERDQALQTAASLAEAFERRDATGTPVSELYREAMRLFLNGELAEAVRKLDDEELSEAVAQAKRQQAEARRNSRRQYKHTCSKDNSSRFNFNLRRRKWRTER